MVEAGLKCAVVGEAYAITLMVGKAEPDAQNLTATGDITFEYLMRHEQARLCRWYPLPEGVDGQGVLDSPVISVRGVSKGWVKGTRLKCKKK